MHRLHRRSHEAASAGGRSLEDQHQLEEHLETLWTLKEQGKGTVSQLHSELGEEEGSQMLLALTKQGWARRDGDRIFFEPDGERIAREVIRRHRLAERMLYDVLEMSWEKFEENACRFEHVLTSEVTESICTFLGHPRICPHGRPIPAGECCRRFTREVTPLVRPLSDLEEGQRGVITFMSTKYRGRLNQLSSLGVVPETIVLLRQRHPAFVIQVGESSIAIDKEIARNIYVRTQSKKSPST